MDAHVQEIRIGVADVDVDFGGELGAQRGPIALEDGAQVVVLLPILGDFFVDHAGLLVPDAHRIAVRRDGAVRCLPDVPLATRP